MSDRWWRAYDRSRRDPKLQRLPAETFRGWYNLVCLASEHGGVLPAIADTAFELRRSEEAAMKLLHTLRDAELFEETERGWSPRKWNTLQYKSDVSTSRVKQFRERQRNVSETPSENRVQRTDSVPNGTGAKAPARDVIFSEALPWLNRRAGKDCRSLVGKWLSEVRDDDAVLVLLVDCERENPVDPCGWITARLQPRESFDDKRVRENRRVIAEQLAKIKAKGIAA